MDYEEELKEETKLEKRSQVEIAWIVFLVHIKAMLFAFTGGNVVQPILQDQFCNKYKIIEDNEMLELYSLGRIMPGALALNGGMLIGKRVAGWMGIAAAVLGTFIPAFVGMLFVTIFYNYVSEIKWINQMIRGISVASIAIIIYNGYIVAKTAKIKTDYVVMIVAFLILIFLNISVLYVTLFCGVLNIVIMFLNDKVGAKNDK